MQTLRCNPVWFRIGTREKRSTRRTAKRSRPSRAAGAEGRQGALGGPQVGQGAAGAEFLRVDVTVREVALGHQLLVPWLVPYFGGVGVTFRQPVWQVEGYLIR